MKARLEIANDNAPAGSEDTSFPLGHGKDRPSLLGAAFGRSGRSLRAAPYAPASQPSPSPSVADIPAPTLRHAQMTERPSLILSRKANAADRPRVWRAPEPQAAPASQRKNFFLNAVIVMWLMSLAANLWALYAPPSSAAHLIIIVSAIWTSLATAYFAQRQGKIGLKEITSFCALLASGLALYGTALRFGTISSAMTGAGLLTGAALMIGWATHSKLCLRLAAVCGFAWIALSVLGTGPSAIIWGFPAFIGLHLWLCAREGDEFAFNLSQIVGYAWLGASLFVLTQAQTLSPIMAISSFAGLGVLQNRIGKGLQDTSSRYGLSVTLWGWMAAMAGSLAIVDFWIRQGLPSWAAVEASAPRTILFGCIAAVLLTLIAAAEFRRTSTRPQSPLKAILVPAAASAVILSPFAMPVTRLQDWLISALPQWADAIQNTSAPLTLMIGIALSGGLAALALTQVINGMRRKSLAMILSGGAALGGIGLLALDSLVASADLLALFGVSAFITLLGAGLFIKTPSERERQYNPAPYSPASS